MPRWQNCITSTIEVAMTARWKVVLSPTLTGMVGSCGATPPASNTITRFGRVRSLREHGRGARQPGADRDGLAVLQFARGAADHQFHRGEGHEQLPKHQNAHRLLDFAQTATHNMPILSKSCPPRNILRDAQ